MSNVGKLSTPTGESTFTKLDVPDTSFGMPGSYTATIKLSDEAFEEVETMLAPAIKKALKLFKSEGAVVKEADLKLPTFINKEGQKCITGRLKAGGKRSDTGEEFENKVKILDGAGDPLPINTMIGKGSKLKMSGDLTAYNFTDPKTGKQNTGISFRLKQVQIIKLVEVRTEKSGKVDF